MTDRSPEARLRQELPEHIIDLAVQVSGWSPCRSKRGVVIFDVGGFVVSHGHNHKPKGFDCDGSAACKATCRVEAIHAEQFALLTAKCSVRGSDLVHVKTVDGRLVPSDGPSCVQCSKLIVSAGIRYVWLYHEDGWRRYDSAEFHRLSLEVALSAGAGVPPALQEKGWVVEGFQIGIPSGYHYRITRTDDPLTFPATPPVSEEAPT